MTDDEKFTAHLAWASKEVATWPLWKQSVLGGIRKGAIMKASDKIVEALREKGIDAKPADCDLCFDGSVYCGLVLILPEGSLTADEFDFDK
jgi:hypothetical protein